MRKRTILHKKTLTGIYRTLYRAFGPQHWWPGENPFEVAVGAILTQNTNWTNVEKAISNLKNKKALSANAMHKMQHRRLASLIKPAGYFNIKAKRLKEFLNFFIEQYSGSIKKMKAEDALFLREKLLGVHGIGPETADSILLYALEKPVFVIDTYTKRIMQRHKIVSDNTTYNEMQEMFHENLPKKTKLYNEYHALFVRLGKDYCKPEPQCRDCPLAEVSV